MGPEPAPAGSAAPADSPPPAHDRPAAAAAAETDPATTAEMDPTATLSAAQSRALFDILMHYQTYAELEGVSAADAANPAAPPTPSPPPSSSPVVQVLHRDLVATFPGADALSPEFWTVRFLGIVDRWYVTASYDKGTLGLRRTLAALASGALEGLARARFGGVRRRAGPEGREDGGGGEEKAASAAAGPPEPTSSSSSGEGSSAEDMSRAWDQVMHAIVYEHMTDELFDALAESDDLDRHSDAVRLAIDFSWIHTATFMHRVFVLSPEGQLLLRLVENAHRLTPYKMIKQAFRVSSPATLVSAVTKLLLAKLSLTSLSNWAGLTSREDEGLNLLQRILTTVLAWDAAEFRRAADRIERDRKGGPDPDHLRRIREHAAASRDEHVRVRALSMRRRHSIAAAILAEVTPSSPPPPPPDGSSSPPDTPAAPVPVPLSDEHHSQLLAYLSALLSVRDRDTIASALAYTVPDLFSGAVREFVAAFEPMLHAAHAALDIRAYLDDSQAFLEEFITCARVKEGSPAPTAADFVDLFRRNRGTLIRWGHRLAVGCPDLWKRYREWAGRASALFRVRGRGDFRSSVDRLFTGLPAGKRRELLPVLDAHAEYLAAAQATSTARLRNVLAVAKPAPAPASSSLAPSSAAQPQQQQQPDSAAAKKKIRLPLSRTTSAASSVAPSPSASPAPAAVLGPGLFVARAQALLDETAITPATPSGDVRWGSEVREGGTRQAITGLARIDVPRGEPRRADAGRLVSELQAQFAELLRSSLGDAGGELETT